MEWKTLPTSVMNKQQKLFWDLLSRPYPAIGERHCNNCVYYNTPYKSKWCVECRKEGDVDGWYTTVWKWNGVEFE